MSLPMEEQDIRLLCHKFGIPELVKTWVLENGKFEESSEYILHEQICNLHPEDALLCISLCLNIIIKHNNLPDHFFSGLEPIIHDIISHYGREALERFTLEIHNEDRLNIEYVAKDLAILAKALENIEPYLFDTHQAPLTIIVGALSIQAGAQTEIARYVLTNFKEEEQRHRPLPKPDQIPFMKTLPVNDNHAGESNH